MRRSLFATGRTANRRGFFGRFLAAGAVLFGGMNGEALAESPTNGPADADLAVRVDRLEDLLRDIDTLVTESYSRLMHNGVLFQSVKESERILSEVRALLDDCSSALGNDRDMGAVKASLDSIQQMLSRR